MDWFDGVLWPIMLVVAWVMVRLYELFVWLGLDPEGGAAWTLSIVGLTIAVRILLIPLFFRQIRATRGLQLIQPEVMALQKKYKGKTDQASREAMAREQMELYRKHKTNPFSSCLPILAQSPVFFALFRVLYSLPAIANETFQRGGGSIGPLTPELADLAEKSTLFGAALSSTFMRSDDLSTKLVTVVLIILMSGSMFFMQRQLTMKNMPPSALEGPIYKQQKMMMYVLPIIFAVTGVNFPIGVLVYWTVSNFWTVGQQFYSIRKMPAPGSEAEAALKERQARKAAARGEVAQDAAPVATIEEAPRPTGQRQQPMRKDRAKKAAQRPQQMSPKKTPSASDEPVQEKKPKTDTERQIREMTDSTALDEPSGGGPTDRSQGPRKPVKRKKNDDQQDTPEQDS
ncbi:MAG: membrane protein insertase YidC [Micrococcales bacterium]|nr:membrane protein insertase YidC [Micrococcales bacterium]